jgi:hypothetical protein
MNVYDNQSYANILFDRWDLRTPKNKLCDQCSFHFQRPVFRHTGKKTFFVFDIV